MKEKLRNRKGITLIALIVTIIVLLILAGISIGAITGNNGIINQAKNAKNDTEYAQWEEQIDIAIVDAESKHREATMDDVIDELINKKVINDESQVDKKTGAITTNEPSYIIEDKLNDYIEPPGLDIVTGNEIENTEVYDNLGNKIIIPAGFKVVNPDSNVEDGIVIEDVGHENTIGSQFVWIPVGEVKKEDGSIINITLSRYTFDSMGNPTDCGSSVINTYYQELATAHSNITAKDIEAFIVKTNNTGGYYIGRYEARTATERTAYNNPLTQITEKPDDYVYNYISQSKAANLSQEMYNDDNFESDLVNSYAWDTAVVFIQECSENTKYSRNNSVNITLASQGTNNLDTKDVVCNIYDMASNCWEWTTENYNSNNTFQVIRGGVATSSNKKYVAERNNGNTSGSSPGAFRPILYL